MSKFNGTTNKGGRTGRLFRTKVLHAMRESAVLHAEHGETAEETEDRFMKNWITRAHDISDIHCTTLLQELIKRMYPTVKSVMPAFAVEFNESDSWLEKAEKTLKAGSTGEVSVDVVTQYMSAIKLAADIEEQTELLKRIELLEQQYESANASK